MRRRDFIFVLSSFFLLIPAVRSSPVDDVIVYLIPLDDFPENLAEYLAKALQENLNLRIKASVRLPPLRLSTLPGVNQYPAEDIMKQGGKASATLPEASSSTLRILLTVRDINSSSGNFRFVFSMQDKDLKCSVVSLARLMEYKDGRRELTRLSVIRLLKLVKRAIGEIKLGWTRSTDPSDVMFAPLMSLDDLDRIGLEHDVESLDHGPKPSQAHPRPAPNAI